MPPICTKCNLPISADHIKAGTQSYHAACFTCYICRHPISDGGYYADVKYGPSHVRCHEERVASKCKSCQSLIDGQYLIDLWGNFHCRACLRNASCKHCGAPASHGRACPQCESMAVSTMPVAQRRFLKVAAFAREVCSFVKGDDLKLELGSTSAMRDKYGENSFSDRTLGQARTTTYTGMGRTTSVVNSVGIVRGLPWPRFDGVVAHELGHVWVAQNDLHFDKVEEEGVCELIAYHWYKRHAYLGATRLAEDIENRNDSIYGKGFRIMRQLQGKMQLKGFLLELSRKRSGL